MGCRVDLRSKEHSKLTRILEVGVSATSQYFSYFLPLFVLYMNYSSLLEIFSSAFTSLICSSDSLGIQVTEISSVLLSLALGIDLLYLASLVPQPRKNRRRNKFYLSDKKSSKDNIDQKTGYDK